MCQCTVYKITCTIFTYTLLEIGENNLQHIFSKTFRTVVRFVNRLTEHVARERENFDEIRLDE